ncbi:MAG: hypothetical protein GKR94_19250 [Gammaproteobacteria bacterium]|nr:hypothetical protein [Gammaproteobacteria bacterium]
MRWELVLATEDVHSALRELSDEHWGAALALLLDDFQLLLRGALDLLRELGEANDHSLSREGLWPAGRWREAWQVWSEESLVLRSWRYAAQLVQIMPDSVLFEIAHAVTWWLDAASKSIGRHELILIESIPLCVGTAV